MKPDSTFNLISDSGPVNRQGEPVVIGVPLPRGVMKDSQSLQLFRQGGTPVPCDVTIMDRWEDQSARWALLQFRAYTEEKNEKFRFQIVPESEQNQSCDSKQIITVEKSGKGYRIDTGTAVFMLAPGSNWPIAQVDGPNGYKWLNDHESGLFLEMADGSTPSYMVDDIKIEVKGRHRVVMNARGTTALASKKRIEIDWRLEFVGGCSIIILHNTIRNPHRAMHPGGYWELGDQGSLLIREAAFKVVAADSQGSAAHAFCSPESQKKLVEIDTPFELYQDSSGGDNYLSHNHINREGKIPIAFRGYRTTHNELSGFRASPVAALKTQGGIIALSMRCFWQNFPKAIEIAQSGLQLGLFPRQWNDVHELQGGEQKTHAFAVSFGSDEITDTPLDWFRNPLRPALSPEWTAFTGAIPYLTPSGTDANAEYEELVDSALKGPHSFECKREIIDEYGWRNFGEIYADHEAVYAPEYKGSDPLVSHYNNQYDVIAGFCYQWLRSGDIGWWTQFEELAGHVVDIDIYHTDEDKAAYNRGLFWHTFHYVDAGLATHRSYPRIGKSNGGGPSNEHIYTTGLMLHYFLTGNMQSRDAAIDLGKFIIDIDDGTKTIFKWLSRTDTGLASASRSAEYHGPGRGSGNALNALLDAHRLTMSSRFMEKAEQLIRRVCHPKQDVEALNLLDAENRWFYTMFLQSLGKYLDYKWELGLTDAMFVYAREVLLHFARWMAKAEYPFLKKPEILEYPTETWPAQDMRKSEVFKMASLYANDGDRSLFLERADVFHRESVKTLYGMQTKHLSRPVVLMLLFGWMNINSMTAQKPLADILLKSFKKGKPFTTQKSNAYRNGKILLSIIVLLVCIIVIIYFAVRSELPN